MNSIASPAPIRAKPGDKSARTAPSVASAMSIALGLCLSGTMLAKELRVPMSDAEVRALGEDPDSGAFFKLQHEPLLDNGDQLKAKGGAATFYTSIAASEFRPRSSALKFIVPIHTTLICQLDSNTSLAEAQIQLPNAAQLQFVRIYASDANENDLNVALVERCQPIAAAGNVSTTVLGSVLTSGTPGRLTQSVGIPGAVNVDNVLCAYSLRVQLNSIVNGCAPDLSLDKVRVQWIQ